MIHSAGFGASAGIYFNCDDDFDFWYYHFEVLFVYLEIRSPQPLLGPLESTGREIPKLSPCRQST